MRRLIFARYSAPLSFLLVVGLLGCGDDSGTGDAATDGELPDGGGGDTGDGSMTMGGELLDPSFGDEGVLPRPTGWSSDVITASAATPDGALVVGGSTGDGFRSAGLVGRFTAEGTLDGTFGRGGFALIPFYDNTSVTDLEAAADGSLFVAGYTRYGLDTYGFVTHLTSTGGVDDTFGDGGVVFWEARDGLYLGLAQAGDGRLLVVSEVDSGTGVELRAFTEAGALDPAYGTGGVAMASGDGEPRGLEVAPDGSAYVITQHSTEGILRRFTASGAPDMAFASSSRYEIPFDVEVFDVAVSGDGNTILVGAGTRVLALDTTGAPVTSFGTDGVLQLVTRGEVAELAWLDAGTFLAVTSLTAEFPRRFPQEIERLAADGSALPFDEGSAVARMASFAPPIVGDGVVYLPGATRALTAAPFGPNELEASIAAMTVETGAPVTTFGDAGLALAGSGASTLIVWDMVRDADGAVRVLGFAGNQGVTMRAADGAFDSGYGEDGIASGRPAMLLFRLAADSAGRVLSSTNGGAVRYLADGSHDESFGDSGFARPPPPGFQMPGIAVAGDDGLYGLGVTLAGGDEVSVVRFDESGAPVSSFGTGGVATVPRATFGDLMVVTPWAIHAEDDSSVVFVAEGIKVIDRFIDVFVAVRLTDDGSLDPSFGTGGVLMIDDVESRRHRIIPRAAGGYFVTGYPTLCGGSEPCTVQIVAFDDAGQAVAAFGEGGVASIEMHGSGLYGFWVGLAEHEGGVLVAGAIDTGRTEQLAVWRLGTDGQLDSGFGAGGRFTLAGEGRATSIVPDGDGFLVGGFRFDPDTGTDPVLVRLVP